MHLTIRKTNEKFLIKKNETIFLDYVSTKEKLTADIEFYGFKNLFEICLFDYRNVTYNNI